MSDWCPSRILCIGNRLLSPDDAGCRVYDVLAKTALPEGVDVVDGGLGGLNLLRLFENRRRVVVCDAGHGFGVPGSVHVLSSDQIAPSAAGGHAAGLAELLAVMPRVLDGPVPEVVVVAVEVPADDAAIGRAAAICRRLAVQPLPSP